MRRYALILFFVASCTCANAQNFQSRSFQYITGILNSSSPIGSLVPTWNSENPPKYFSFAITGTPTGPIQMRLEGSVDGVNFSTLGITTSVNGMTSVSAAMPSLYFRMRAFTINSADTITGTAIGVW